LPKEDRLIIRSRSSSRRIRYLLCRNQYRFLFRTGRPSDVLTLFVGVTLVRAFMRIKEFLATAAVQPDQQVSAVITVSQGDLIRFEGFQILISLWHGRRRKMMISTHCDLQNASKVACCIYKQLQRMYIFRAVESVTVETCCYCRWSLLFAFVAAALLRCRVVKVITIVIDGFLRLEIGSRHFLLTLKISGAKKGSGIKRDA
jgi:hypothetical protein